jgi:hypothetical protein
MKVACKGARSGYVVAAPPRLWIPTAGRWEIEATLPSGHVVVTQWNVTNETSKTLDDLVGTEDARAGPYRLRWSREDAPDYIAQERTFELCDFIDDVLPRAERPEVVYIVSPTTEAFTSLQLPTGSRPTRFVIGATVVSAEEQS